PSSPEGNTSEAADRAKTRGGGGARAAGRYLPLKGTLRRRRIARRRGAEGARGRPSGLPLTPLATVPIPGRRRPVHGEPIGKGRGLGAGERRPIGFALGLARLPGGDRRVHALDLAGDLFGGHPVEDLVRLVALAAAGRVVVENELLQHHRQPAAAGLPAIARALLHLQWRAVFLGRELADVPTQLGQPHV